MMRLALLLALTLGACATTRPVAHSWYAGPVAPAGGVGLEARTTVDHVAERVLEIEVAVANGTGRPLRVRRADFALVAPGGALSLRPLTAAELRGRLLEPADPMSPEVTYPAPRSSGSYAALGPGAGVGERDPFFGGTYYAYEIVPQPTPQMAREALPEGALEPGGAVGGVLYFATPEVAAGPLHVTLELVDATTGARLGTVMTPVGPR